MSDKPKRGDSRPGAGRKPMNLDSFLFEQIQNIEQFEQFWRRRRASDPQDYPDEMAAGQWDDQLALWKESDQDAR